MLIVNGNSLWHSNFGCWQGLTYTVFHFELIFVWSPVGFLCTTSTPAHSWTFELSPWLRVGLANTKNYPQLHQFPYYQFFHFPSFLLLVSFSDSFRIFPIAEAITNHFFSDLIISPVVEEVACIRLQSFISNSSFILKYQAALFWILWYATAFKMIQGIIQSKAVQVLSAATTVSSEWLDDLVIGLPSSRPWSTFHGLISLPWVSNRVTTPTLLQSYVLRSLVGETRFLLGYFDCNHACHYQRYNMTINQTDLFLSLEAPPLIQPRHGLLHGPQARLLLFYSGCLLKHSFGVVLCFHRFSLCQCFSTFRSLPHQPGLIWSLPASLTLAIIFLIA